MGEKVFKRHNAYYIVQSSSAYRIHVEHVVLYHKAYLLLGLRYVYINNIASRGHERCYIAVSE